jgi:hypothetical protein
MVSCPFFALLVLFSPSNPPRQAAPHEHELTLDVGEVLGLELVYSPSTQDPKLKTFSVPAPGKRQRGALARDAVERGLGGGDLERVNVALHFVHDAERVQAVAHYAHRRALVNQHGVNREQRQAARASGLLFTERHGSTSLQSLVSLILNLNP